MAVRFLDSRDVETLADAMWRAAGTARELDVAAAFLTAAGVDQILALAGHLSPPKKRQEVRVVVGTWLGVTDPAALKRLWGTKGIKVRVSQTPGFHVKHAVLRGDSAVTTFTGSANFTAKGLGGQGELVVEVTEKPRSSFASVERDSFRHLWDAGFPDDLTAEVISAYSRMPRPTFSGLNNEGERYGKSLLERFGKRLRAAEPKDDGSTLWLYINGTLSTATESALYAQAAGERKPDFVSLTARKWLERVNDGARRLWVLDVRGKSSARKLELYQVVRVLEMPTPSDGRYFAILRPPARKIGLGRNNRQALKDIGLVDRIDSLASQNRSLSKGKIAKLLELSTAIKK
jgi:HKD family nuclease